MSLRRLGPEMAFVFHLGAWRTLEYGNPHPGSDPLKHDSPHTSALKENFKLGDLQDYECHDNVLCFLASY